MDGISYIKNLHRRTVRARVGMSRIPRRLRPLRVLAACLIFSIIAETFPGWAQYWTLTSLAYAYKVKRVCENVTTKKGTTEKCATKLVKDGEDNGGGGKPSDSKDPHTTKKDSQAAPSGGH
jgi:hypothetical protein